MNEFQLKAIVKSLKNRGHDIDDVVFFHSQSDFHSILVVKFITQGCLLYASTAVNHKKVPDYLSFLSNDIDSIVELLNSNSITSEESEDFIRRQVLLRYDYESKEDHCYYHSELEAYMESFTQKFLNLKDFAFELPNIDICVIDDFICEDFH